MKFLRFMASLSLFITDSFANEAVVVYARQPIRFIPNELGTHNQNYTGNTQVNELLSPSPNIRFLGINAYLIDVQYEGSSLKHHDGTTRGFIDNAHYEWIYPEVAFFQPFNKLMGLNQTTVNNQLHLKQTLGLKAIYSDYSYHTSSWNMVYQNHLIHGLDFSRQEGEKDPLHNQFVSLKGIVYRHKNHQLQLGFTSSTLRQDSDQENYNTPVNQPISWLQTNDQLLAFEHKPLAEWSSQWADNDWTLNYQLQLGFFDKQQLFFSNFGSSSLYQYTAYTVNQLSFKRNDWSLSLYGEYNYDYLAQQLLLSQDRRHRSVTWLGTGFTWGELSGVSGGVKLNIEDQQLSAFIKTAYEVNRWVSDITFTYGLNKGTLYQRFGYNESAHLVSNPSLQDERYLHLLIKTSPYALYTSPKLLLTTYGGLHGLHTYHRIIFTNSRYINSPNISKTYGGYWGLDLRYDGLTLGTSLQGVARSLLSPEEQRYLRNSVTFHAGWEQLHYQFQLSTTYYSGAYETLWVGGLTGPVTLNQYTKGYFGLNAKLSYFLTNSLAVGFVYSYDTKQSVNTGGLVYAEYKA